MNFRFEYSPKSQSFLANRIDENEEYARSIDVFEYLIKKDRKIGQVIVPAPVPMRRVPVLLGGLRGLAFCYYHTEKSKQITMYIFKIEFDDELPL